jgi:hypothetical protein
MIDWLIRKVMGPPPSYADPVWEEIERRPATRDEAVPSTLVSAEALKREWVNLEAVDPGTEIGVKAMARLQEAPSPLVYGGTAPNGVEQISVVVPLGCPVDTRRLWLEICEATAREAARVGIPLEGETTEEFMRLVRDRGLPGLDPESRPEWDPYAGIDTWDGPR